MKICKELEREFNLIPLKKGQRETLPVRKRGKKKSDAKNKKDEECNNYLEK
ncbi:hypothetical protein [Dysgonomonas termitidis]|uniref:Uncharacterized protein n=1 Tax=Dysgonomonas termitidis TaxID=1516126 RepID=A0ABV9KRN8_9BACT